MNSKVTHINVGNLAENCWFLANEDTKEAVVIDPGAEPDRICAAAEKHGWKITAILLTHGHIDHMGACESLRTELGVKVYALTEEEDLLLDAKKNLSVFIERKVVTFEPDELLRDGQELTLAGMKIQVIHTPGHTPGGCSYYVAEAGCVFSGDTLFAESVGRSDFPGGSTSALVCAVKEKLFLLPDDTLVCPGHGEETTIGHEKKYNSFV